MKKKIVIACAILITIAAIFVLGGLFKEAAPGSSTKAGDSSDTTLSAEESTVENSRGSEASASTADRSAEESTGYSENSTAETEPRTSVPGSADVESTEEGSAGTTEEGSSAEESTSEENSESGSEAISSENTTEETPSESSTSARPTEPPTRPTESTEAKTEPTQPSTAHTHTTAERVKKAATCKETGTKEIYCTECREVISTVTIQKLAHTTAERTRQAATCTAAGVKETYCTKCGDVISTASIPKLSHTTERHVVREATTTAEGLYQMVCTVCHTVVSEGSIPMIETEPAPTWTVTVTAPIHQESVQRGYGSIAGAVYGLYKDGSRIGTYTTGSNGGFTAGPFEVGSGYELRLEQASQGYVINGDYFDGSNYGGRVGIYRDGAITYSLGTEGKAYSFMNESCSIQRVDSDVNEFCNELMEYAVSLGLQNIGEPTGCYSGDCYYLYGGNGRENIQSRLRRYADNEDIEGVWIAPIKHYYQCVLEVGFVYEVYDVRVYYG